MSLSFEEWFNEIEGYATRGERFVDDFECEDVPVARGIDWLLAAYNAGFKQGQYTLNGINGAPTPPYVKYPTTSNPNPYPNPFKEIHYSTWPNVKSCSKCGIKLEGVMGYVCYDNNCPTFMRTSSGTISAGDYKMDNLSGKADAGGARVGAVGSTMVYGYSEGLGMGEIK